jgi:capsular exopolysaccharide synthesis family protein
VTDLAASPLPFNNPTLAAYGNSAALRGDIDQREAERAMLATHYGANHPKLLEAERAIATMREALRENFAIAVKELEARVQLAASREKELEGDLQTLLDQAAEVERVSAELATLDQRLAARRTAHANLLSRIAEAGISAELPADVMRVVDHAAIRRPLLPPAVVLSAAGIGGAVLLFIGGPLVWHACRRRISSTLDLERMLGTELYGVVPRLPWMWSSHRPHLVRRGRKVAVVEAFLGMASQFELRTPGGCPRRIVISSTLPGEGKSVVASNLAAAFTRLGYRALLVDADFRRPTQQRFHRIPNAAGLLRWIEGGCPGGGDAALDDIGLHALPGGTWLLPTGGTDPEPARHFMRPEVQALFDRLAREFDVIIIDTPPAGLFPDAFFVTRFADAAALVVREGVPVLDQVRKVLADFHRTATPVTGIIFNAISGGIAHPSFGYRRVAARYARHYAPAPRQLPVRPRNAGPVAAETISR